MLPTTPTPQIPGPIPITPAIEITDPEYVWTPYGTGPGCCIYLCEDAAGDLLYIGYTGNWDERRVHHRRASTWWPEVERVHILRARGDMDHLRRNEYVLIEALHPRHNRLGHAPRTLQAERIAGRRLRLARTAARRAG